MSQGQEVKPCHEYFNPFHSKSWTFRILCLLMLGHFIEKRTSDGSRVMLDLKYLKI